MYIVVFVQTGGQNLALDDCVVYIACLSFHQLPHGREERNIDERERKGEGKGEGEKGRKEEDNIYTR